LCESARFTGYQIDGGFAEFTAAEERFCFRLPDGFPDLQAAPLLCAGLIGYRSYRMTGRAQRIGFFGFGAAAHILVQVASYQGRQVYAFTRPGDLDGQKFARKLGAVWAGDPSQAAPGWLDAAILFAPAGELVPAALRAVTKGGIVVCAGIHMSDIPSFPYEILWGERQIRSVANLTRQDGEEFLDLAPKIPIHTSVTCFPLTSANEALTALRSGLIQGAAVLSVQSPAQPSPRTQED
jgi:propanol-preferring alcohol dehydrogenase